MHFFPPIHQLQPNSETDRQLFLHHQFITTNSFFLIERLSFRLARVYISFFFPPMRISLQSLAVSWYFLIFGTEQGYFPSHPCSLFHFLIFEGGVYTKQTTSLLYYLLRSQNPINKKQIVALFYQTSAVFCSHKNKNEKTSHFFSPKKRPFPHKKTSFLFSVVICGWLWYTVAPLCFLVVLCGNLWSLWHRWLFCGIRIVVCGVLWLWCGCCSKLSPCFPTFEGEPPFKRGIVSIKAPLGIRPTQPTVDVHHFRKKIIFIKTK